MSIISVRDLCKEFQYYEKKYGLKGSFKNLFDRTKLIKKAVNNISFDVEQGEVVGFLGPNGAGKTTTLKMLSGILVPTFGSATVNGFVPWEREKEYKMCFALVSGQKSQLWHDLPALESFALNKEIYEIDDAKFKKFLGEVTELLDVEKVLKVQVRRLSLGERMKMELIASLLHQPRIMFLDEPTIGLDLTSQINIRNFLKEYNEKYHTTIIITSHYLKDIEDLCKRTIVINNGECVYDGSLTGIGELFDQRKSINIKSQTKIDNKFFEEFGEIKYSSEYEVTLLINKTEVNKAIEKILYIYPEVDISIDKASIEEGVRMLYEKV